MPQAASLLASLSQYHVIHRISFLIGALISFLVTLRLLPNIITTPTTKPKLSDPVEELRRIETDLLPPTIQWPLPTYTWKKPQEVLAVPPKGSGAADKVGRVLDRVNGIDAVVNDRVDVCAKEFGQLKKEYYRVAEDGFEKGDKNEATELDGIWKSLRKECQYVMPEKAWKEVAKNRAGANDRKKIVVNIKRIDKG